MRENRTFEELEVGESAVIERLCRDEDLIVYANASGDHNPLGLPDEDGDGDGAPEALAPAMWVASVISAVVGNILPGPGSQVLAARLRFAERLAAGRTLRVELRVAGKREGGVVLLHARAERDDGAPLAEGEIEALAPARKMRFDDAHVPGLTVQRHLHFRRLLEAAEGLEPLSVAVAAAESPEALEGALAAMRRGLIRPILTGRPERVAGAAQALGEDVSAIELIAAQDEDDAARRAVALVREGRARALMKGHLHTDALLRAALDRERGLRAGRRLSHVFVMDVPGLDRLLAVTDAAVNIAPDLAQKRDILQNAVDLMRALGVETPRAAALSAVETVNPAMASSVEAAALAKMAERGQIRGALVDGPLAMDNAVDLSAARTKGIGGEVAGRADILLAPDLESANMAAKELTFLAHASAAGVVVGAAAPIILTSRADDEMSRLVSCAAAALAARAMG
ncbi:bifunctional enoyl-CoA hydratase/phosphate acetyltransferase [Oceanicella actignis]|nr:bifunctional enoyl-CoA hydratase/phosphate acetyltransferase [Oceanicella actignis]TYO85168.1 phosphate butyryltransferase [Oceanicella actignis]